MIEMLQNIDPQSPKTILSTGNKRSWYIRVAMCHPLVHALHVTTKAPGMNTPFMYQMIQAYDP
jgi:hypothetical protein